MVIPTLSNLRKLVVHLPISVFEVSEGLINNVLHQVIMARMIGQLKIKITMKIKL